MSSSRRRKSFTSSSSSSSPSFHSPPPTSRLRPRSPPSSSTKTSPTSTTPLATNILLFLIAFRLVNAFTVRTFFQPDEYFQSLEPAWQIAFGESQGAWITWVSGVAYPDIIVCSHASHSILFQPVTLFQLLISGYWMSQYRNGGIN